MEQLHCPLEVTQAPPSERLILSPKVHDAAVTAQGLFEHPLPPDAADR